MAIVELSRINLNLLVTFQVLMEEGNVTRAAERLSVSQSAVSKSLAQLRDVLGDPLFLRSAHGLTPTGHAIQLAEQLAPTLEHIWHLVQAPSFSPAFAQRTFRIAVSDSSYLQLIAGIVPELLEEAPGIQLITHHLDMESIHDLEKGALDLVIMPEDVELSQSASSEFHSSILYRDTCVCLCRRDHPIMSEAWSLESYLQQQHVQVAINDYISTHNIIDDELIRMGTPRDVAVVVSGLPHAAILCEKTDLIFTCSNSWASYAVTRYDVVKIDVPFPVAVIANRMWSHKRSEFDLGVLWLQEKISEYARHINLDLGEKS